MSAVTDAYVDVAGEAGLLHDLNGLTVLCDIYVEPVSGRSQCLVEHFEPHGQPWTPSGLCEAVAERWPDCDDVVVRTSAPLGPPFSPLLSYLVRDPGPMEAVEPPQGVRIVREQQGHHESVAAMLQAALERACSERGWEPDPRRIGSVVERLVASPDRVTFVADRDGECLGHSTLLLDAYDGPTERRYVELLDVLVDPREPRRLQSALVAEALHFVAETGVPALGHVVHDARDPQHAARVAEGLRRAGWRPIHSYEIASLADDTASSASLAPPASWHDPQRHLVAAAESAWYQLCTSLMTAILHVTHDFYRARGIEPVLMPVTVGSVSSPMGLGSDSIPVSIDLHGERTYLADSMQFQLEFLLRHGLVGAYYVMPTFRGEDPDATHLNQFFHSEAEIRGGLSDVMRLVEEHVVAFASGLVTARCSEDLERVAGGLGHLRDLVDAGTSGSLPRITFDEAVDLLGTPAFEDRGPGRLTIRRQAEQELVRRVGGAVWLTHPPHPTVPFYQAFDESGTRALAADLLMGGVGEVVGCGQRHTDARDLLAALRVHEVDEDEYRWYRLMKQRQPLLTSGFGLGVERFLLFATRHDDIRDLHVMPRLKGSRSWL